jgi:hypothetical protein
MSDDPIIRGRAEVAAALGVTERTVTRLVERGILPARKCGPFQNSPLAVSLQDIERVRQLYQGEAA